MQRNCWVGLFVSAVAVATCRVAVADQIALTDGSVLVGVIERMADGKLVVATDFAGKLEIDAAKIKAISSAGKVNVSLKSGERLVGKMTPSPDGARSIVDSGVGQIGVAQDQIAMLWPEGQPSPEMAAAEKAIADAKPKWTASAEGGLIGTEGNSDTLSANFRGNLTRKTADDLLTFYSSADYSEQNDRRNKHQVIVGGRYENALPHHWENWGGPYHWYMRTEFEYDEFEDLDLRATIAGGLGHYWIRKDRMDFTTRGGAGYRHQSFNSGRTTNDAILDLGYDFRYDVREWLRFTQSLVYSPSVEDFGDYRVTLDNALTFPIGKTDQWKFKTGVRKEYNSDPQPGFDSLDSIYYANVLLEIK